MPDKINGLALGADDYLTKPCRVKNLEIRQVFLRLFALQGGTIPRPFSIPRL